MEKIVGNSYKLQCEPWGELLWKNINEVSLYKENALNFKTFCNAKRLKCLYNTY